MSSKISFNSLRFWEKKWKFKRLLKITLFYDIGYIYTRRKFIINLFFDNYVPSNIFNALFYISCNEYNILILFNCLGLGFYDSLWQFANDYQTVVKNFDSLIVIFKRILILKFDLLFRSETDFAAIITFYDTY